MNTKWSSITFGCYYSFLEGMMNFPFCPEAASDTKDDKVFDDKVRLKWHASTIQASPHSIDAVLAAT